jgi:glycerol uptake facilitator
LEESRRTVVRLGRVTADLISLKSEKELLMTSPFLGEFMGTAVLILLGNGVVANVLLKKSKGEGGGWIVISAGWAFAVLCGVLTAIACGSHEAYLNPAVTLGFAIVSGDFAKLLPYVIAQILGAITGAGLVWLHYLPHWGATADPSLKLACYSTSPAIRNFATNAMSEIIGTFVLVFVVGAIFSKEVSSTGFPPGFGPYLVGCLVWAIGLSLGGPTGYAINPARDLGPRIAHALLPIAGKGPSDWGYSLIPVAGPLIGAAIAGAAIRAIQF